MKTLRRIFLFALLPLLACVAGLKKYSESFFSMDSLVEVTFFSGSPGAAREVVSAMKAECQRIEDRFGVSKEGSEIRKINERPDRSRVVTDSEVAGLVRTALALCEETGGAFDITLGPVKWLWGLGTGQVPNVPTDEALRRVLRQTGYRKVSVQGDTLFFADTAVQLDMGGIAQGYALTRLAAILRSRGITAFMLNVSGDIMMGDPKPDGQPWIIGVRHPRRSGELLDKIPLSNTCIITSGDYERFFFQDSIRYHHIIDSKTGYPSKGVISATVIADDPIRADVYSTVLVARGRMTGDSLPMIRRYLLLNEKLERAGFNPSDAQAAEGAGRLAR